MRIGEHEVGGIPHIVSLARASMLRLLCTAILGGIASLSAADGLPRFPSLAYMLIRAPLLPESYDECTAMSQRFAAEIVVNVERILLVVTGWLRKRRGRA